MLKKGMILDESDKRVRQKNVDVVFPLSKDDKKMIKEMLKHLKESQIEDIAKKYDLRPGMGLAAPQVGINKRFFVICHEEEPNKFKDYVMINPTLVSHSMELVYVGSG